MATTVYGSGSSQVVIEGVGNLDDFVTVPYDMGENSTLAHLNTNYQHVHGKAFVYPVLASDVTITSGTGAWGTGGTITEIIPDDGLENFAFDLHWINISAHSADGFYLIEIYAGDSGSEELVSSTRSWRDSTFFGGETAIGTKRIQIPQQEAGTRISAKLYDSSGGTATVQISFEGHYYGA